VKDVFEPHFSFWWKVRYWWRHGSWPSYHEMRTIVKRRAHASIYGMGKKKLKELETK
jgi:hypothetical protein